MFFLLLEDDRLQAPRIKGWLWQAFPGAEVRIFYTEKSFYGWLKEVVRPPTVAILDVMVVWDDFRGSGSSDRPAEVEEGGIAVAGIRCARKLRENQPTANVPVVFYTVLKPREDLPSDIEDLGLLLEKSDDPAPLIAAIRQAIPNR